MRLYIRNSAMTSPVPVEVRQGDSIAALKARYRRSLSFVGSRNFIQLQYAGETLDDTKTIHDYGFKPDAVIAHVPSSSVQAAYAPVDYDAMALALQEEHVRLRGGQDFADYNPNETAGGRDWDPSWTHGDEWKQYPPNMWSHWARARKQPSSAPDASPSSSIVLARPPGPLVAYADVARAARRTRETAQNNQENYPFQPQPRIFRNLYIAQVGRFQFRLLHRMEGRWNGDATMQTVMGPPNNTGMRDQFGRVSRQIPSIEQRICAVSLTFDEPRGVWKETQTLTSEDGMSHSQSVVYRPVGDGVCQVLGDHMYSWEDCDIKLEEKSEHVVMLTATSHHTGKPLIVETVTVIDDYRRVRTVQRFDEGGNFQCLYLMRESRVLDTVSGAIAEMQGVHRNHGSSTRSTPQRRQSTNAESTHRQSYGRSELSEQNVMDSSNSRKSISRTQMDASYSSANSDYLATVYPPSVVITEPSNDVMEETNQDQQVNSTSHQSASTGDGMEEMTPRHQL